LFKNDGGDAQVHFPNTQLEFAPFFITLDGLLGVRQDLHARQ
jgi:hypothetical protein